LDTKSTRKKPSYNRKQLAEKLENLSDRVASRGIYISRKNDYDQWDVYDYGRDNVVFDNIPSRDIAEKICERYNKNLKYSTLKHAKIRSICNNISKHSTDCIFYLYTIQHTDDFDKYLHTKTRLQYAKDQIKKLVSDLIRTLF